MDLQVSFKGRKRWWINQSQKQNTPRLSKTHHIPIHHCQAKNTHTHKPTKANLHKSKPITTIYYTMTHHAPDPLRPRPKTHHPATTKFNSHPTTSRSVTHDPQEPKPRPSDHRTHAHWTTIVDHRTIAATTHNHRIIKPRPTTQNQNPQSSYPRP